MNFGKADDWGSEWMEGIETAIYHVKIARIYLELKGSLVLRFFDGFLDFVQIYFIIQVVNCLLCLETFNRRMLSQPFSCQGTRTRH